MDVSKALPSPGLGLKIAVLLVLVLAGSRAVGAARLAEEGDSAGVTATSWRDATVTELESSELVPVELMLRAEDRGAVGSLGLEQTEIIDEMDFEDPTFPPENWEVDDQITRTFGPDAFDTWSRQICQTESPTGGEAAAWAAGGGTNGDTYACGQNIGKPLGTRLFRDGIDTSDYPFGVQVDFTVWLDLPLLGESSRAMKVCWRETNSTQAQCSSIVINSENLLKRWLGLNAPIVFSDAANKASIELMFWFDDVDDLGNGGGDFAGAFVDNVVIEGLSEAPPPSPTPLISPTPSATLSVDPTTPTSEATPTDGPAVAFLPVLLANADKDDVSQMPEAPSQGVIVQFGTAIDPNDRVQNIGDHFQYGHMRLCAQVTWFGWPDSTEISWQWYQKSGAQFVEIGSATLNDSVTVGQENRNYISKCIAAVDGEGNDVPIWMNEYKVEAFVDGATQAAAEKIAMVTTDPPPGATALPLTPTPWPTGQASPTPKATSGPPLESGCRQLAENGDFERGPSVGWTLRTNVNPPNNTTARVIMRAADLGLLTADGGEWLGIMGRAVSVRDQLLTEPFQLPAAAQMISATLDYGFGIVTEEAKDGNNDDIMLAALVNQDGQAEAIPASGISEEVIDANNWYSLTNPLDMTALLTARAGWTSAQLMFQSENDAEAPSAHLLDQVELIMCIANEPLHAADPLPAHLQVEPVEARASVLMQRGQLRPVMAMPQADAVLESPLR